MDISYERGTPVARGRRGGAAGALLVVARDLMLKEIKLNLSGNEVYYTVCSLLVILKNPCSKLHYQRGFDLNPFSYKICEWCCSHLQDRDD